MNVDQLALLPGVDIVFAIIWEHDFKNEGTENMHFLLQKLQSLSAARYISHMHFPIIPRGTKAKLASPGCTQGSTIIPMD